MNIQIMYNNNSKIQARILKSKLLSNGFNVVDNLSDLVIIIGGDGYICLVGYMYYSICLQLP